MVPNYLLAKDSPRPEPLVFDKKRGNAWEDDYEDDFGLWRHPRPVDAEGPVWIYIRAYEWPDNHKHGHKWAAELIGVSAFFASDNTIAAALSSTGDYLQEHWKDMTSDQREQAVCEMLIDYGAKITLCHKTSKRSKGPFKGCAVEAVVAVGLWGFIADRQANGFGNTGWDFLKGEIGFRSEPKKPSGFAATVIAWLNRYYKGRKAYHREDS